MRKMDNTLRNIGIEHSKIVKETVLDIVPVYFRVWIYTGKEPFQGVIDLVYPFSDNGDYLDLQEARVIIDKYGVFRLHRRNRGKDLSEEWFPIIESHLLAPLSVGSVDLWHEHLFGKGEIHRILAADIFESRLKNVEIISPREYQKQAHSLIGKNIPNAIPKGAVSSYENFHSRLFEHAVGKYIQSEYDYPLVQVSFSPPYLSDKEIDVFAERGNIKKTITTCECKLKFNNSSVTLDDVKKYHKKIKILEKYENNRGNTKFHHWLVSNSPNFEDSAKKFATQHGIEVKQAVLSKNWKNRSDWSVNRIY